MGNPPALLDSIALLEGLPEQRLVRGQVGTVVETLAPDLYEVVFNNNTGRTYATASLHANQLMVLRHEPVHSARISKRR